jgi:hypothetical protein
MILSDSFGVNKIASNTVINTIKFVRRKYLNGILHNLATDATYDFGPVSDAIGKIYSIDNERNIICCDNGFHSVYFEGIYFYKKAYDFGKHGNHLVSAYLVQLFGEYDLFTYAAYGHKIASRQFKFIRQLSIQEIEDLVLGRIDYQSPEFNIADLKTLTQRGI